MRLKSLWWRLPVRRGAADPEAAWEPGDAAPWPRLAVILRPQAPYLAWVRGCCPGTRLSLAQMRADPIVYLVPTSEFDPAEAQAFVATHYGRFFAQELEQWTTDRARWPAPRSWDLFRRWFEVEVIDRVIDVV